MILILSSQDDVTAGMVADKLKERGADFFRFDPGRYPAQSQLSLRYAGGKSSSRNVQLQLDDRTIDLDAITAAWRRRPSAMTPHEAITDPVRRLYVKNQSAHFIADLWRVLDCRWIPGPRSNVWEAEYKGLQLKRAVQLGLEIPPTLMTNNPADFLAFWQEHNGQLICKSLCDGVVWKTEEQTEDGEVAAALYTQVVSWRDLGYASAVQYAPVIFQAYVPKRLELRITVVGQQVFACEIHSQRTRRTQHDWRRYDLAHTPHKPHDLPVEIQRQCVGLVETLGLCYGAIDMILTPDGRYVFLEINPSGQYGWIEIMTGLPISEAICDLLMSFSKVDKVGKVGKVGGKIERSSGNEQQSVVAA